MPGKPTSIDDYLSSIDERSRALLAELRRTIRSIVPDAEECISYSMPAFRLGKHVIAGFQATSSGGSYYPFSGSTLATLGDAIAGYRQTKSALHFDAKKKLSRALVKKLLDARIAETAGAATANKQAKRGATRPATKKPVAKKARPAPPVEHARVRAATRASVPRSPRSR